MSDDAEHKRTFLCRVHLWMAVQLVLAAALTGWCMHSPGLAEWVRGNTLFLYIAGGLCMAVCLWGCKHLTTGALRAALPVPAAVTGLLLGGLLPAETAEYLLTGMGGAAVVWGLIAGYGYLTSNAMEGTRFTILCVLAALASLPVLWLLCPEAEVLIFPVLYGITLAVPHPKRVNNCSVSGDEDAVGAKEEVRDSMVCLAYPLSLLVVLSLVGVVMALGLLFSQEKTDDDE